jgi:carbonic anhydrase
MLPTRFTQTNVGDMFIVRNVGNCVPHASHTADPAFPATEPAMLELGVVVQGIKHVIVCGHSDCKAMNLLYTVHKASQWDQGTLAQSPIRAWMSK